MTKTRDLSDFLIEGGADLPLGKPHIVPGVLQPAVAGKLLNGANHSGAYGTPQTQSGGDGHSYYYTDIKGSKPIKDPRIGAHFGSQRHKFKSLQLLEQETATHGSNVYSVDGREWCRVVGSSNAGMVNDNHGNYLWLDATGDFIEIIGYFNDFNTIAFTHTNRADDVSVKINGGTSRDNDIIAGKTSVFTPLGYRYVDAGSVINHGDTNVTSDLGTTPKINTLKLELTNISSEYFLTYGIELIAQDTTSTANRSKIQIPAQNVVSFGKKFPISATAVHYDPFTTMSYGGSGTTLSALQSLIDTDTSLGMDAWKAGTSNYHRPWNGGRVIKWVDSSGTIKTSVNMMPPNAQNIGTTASNAVSDAHVIAGTNDDTINFNTSAIDHSQSELAKSFHFREFGNGSANGGTGANYADWSMLTASNDDVAYVMDDGLTSLTGVTAYAEVNSGNGEIYYPGQNNYYSYLTFIGTGISIKAEKELNKPVEHIAQNLPYGSHVVKFQRDGSNSKYVVDGVDFGTVSNSGVGGYTELLLKQPKRPPIPEDCVVLADYMLMADFVSQTTGGIGLISKGVRSNSVSRDVFSNIPSSAAFDTMLPKNNQHHGFRISTNSTGSSDTDHTFRLPSFGTTYLVRGYHFDDRHKLFVDTTEKAHTHNGTDYESFGRLSTALDLGVHKFGANAKTSKNPNISAFEIVTPIHTSHHYQSFESPFLHELVGGDRNMEQTNLVCSPDGKTWDEITRDTSYIGNLVLVANEDGSVGADTTVVFKDRRGTEYTYRNYFNKDSFAIAYDRDICLKDGWYHINVRTASVGGGTTKHCQVRVNGTELLYSYPTDSGTTQTVSFSIFLKRGDYIEVRGKFNADALYNNYEITRLK